MPSVTGSFTNFVFFTAFLLTLIRSGENSVQLADETLIRLSENSARKDEGTSLKKLLHHSARDGDVFSLFPVNDILKSALGNDPILTETQLKLDSAPSSFRGKLKRGANGGFQCATCVILLGLVERWSVVNNASIDVNLVKFCNLVPGKVNWLTIQPTFYRVT